MIDRPFRIVLISTYELGHPPFGVASPAAWLVRAGAVVTCLDLAVQALDAEAVRAADLIAMYVPMHTATRLAAGFVPRLRALNPRAHLAFYGLYAPVNEAYLRGLGAGTVLGGEFEQGLVALAERLARGGETTQAEPVIALERQAFIALDRSLLPPLSKYAYLDAGNGTRHLAGYTEATRGCKHLCRHCPIVPVYGGRFFVIPRGIVLDDIRQQVEAGAEHISFGDPDFLNGPGHARALVRELHARWPRLTYDVIIKVEHLLRYADDLRPLRETGCLWITSAVEAVQDDVLARLDKGHTRADFCRAAELVRVAGLVLQPTFVAFTPWTTRAGYLDLLDTVDGLDLVEQVPPIQFAIRLLIPSGSRLLELEEVQALVGPFDARALCYPWKHPDPTMDELAQVVSQIVQRSGSNTARRETFSLIRARAQGLFGTETSPPARARVAPNRPIPHLSEPWYC